MAAQVVPVALTGADQTISPTACTYHGFAIRETTTTTVAVVRIYDSTSANSGTLLETLSIAANESVGDFYERGIVANLGIRVDIVSGTVEGSIRIS